MKDDWKLKPTFLHQIITESDKIFSFEVKNKIKDNGIIYYSKEDVETLRQKLIEDIESNEDKWLTKGSVDLDVECIEAIIRIINRRFGVE